MRSDRSAIWTSQEPVSPGFLWCFWTISCRRSAPSMLLPCEFATVYSRARCETAIGARLIVAVAVLGSEDADRAELRDAAGGLDQRDELALVRQLQRAVRGSALHLLAAELHTVPYPPGHPRVDLERGQPRRGQHRDHALAHARAQRLESVQGDRLRQPERPAARAAE